MKKILSLVLAMFMLVAMVPGSLYADSNSNGNGNKNKNNIKHEEKAQIKFEKKDNHDALKTEVKDRLRLMTVYGEGTWVNLPHGLAKRDSWNPGLQMLFDENRLPYGLAKRLGDFTNHDDESDLDALNKLIDKADVLLSTENTKSYVPSAKAAFEVVVADAKAFVAAYTPTKFADVNAKIAILKTAITTFKNAELYGTSYLDNIKALKVELLAYKTTYFVGDDSLYINTDHYKAYVALLAKIEPFVQTTTPQMLTKSDYVAIMDASKAFEDHLVAFKALIENAKTKLYTDLTATPLAFKHLNGVEPDMYFTGSNVALQTAIATAEKFVVDYTTLDYVAVNNAQVALQTAITTFEGNLVLGSEDIVTLQGIQTLLEEQYKLTATAPLKTLIDTFKLYTIADGETLLKVNSVTLLNESKPFVKNLYDYVVLELQKLVTAANVVVDAEYIADEAVLTALDNQINTAELYLAKDATSYLYSELNSNYQLLSTAIKTVKTSVVTKLETLVASAEAAVEVGGYTVPATVTDVEDKVAAIKVYLAKGASEYDYSELKTFYETLNLAIIALK